MNRIKSFFKKLTQPYKLSSKTISLYDEINLLKMRIEELERQSILSLSRIEELERENISSINAMYEISNSLEARIDMLSAPVLDFGDENYVTENF